MVKLFLSGDVMTGRGVDQILGHPGDPGLWERYVRDARRYVKLAEAVSGQIPRPAGDAWIWGDALREFHRSALDARIINLETSVTVSDRPQRGKGVHYRMHPGTAGCATRRIGGRPVPLGLDLGLRGGPGPGSVRPPAGRGRRQRRPRPLLAPPAPH